MKEIKTCEEYVLNELAESKALLARCEKACKGYVEVLNEVDGFRDVLKGLMKRYKSADGREIITMGYVFNDFDAETFKLLQDTLGLKLEGED